MVDFTRAYHIGVRVPDLDVAMAEMGTSLGLTWAAVQERDQSVWTPATGAVAVPLRFTYSAEGPQHLELLQGAPGSVWHAGDAPGITTRAFGSTTLSPKPTYSLRRVGPSPPRDNHPTTATARSPTSYHPAALS